MRMGTFTRLRHEEDGLTLTELMVATLILGLVSGVFLTTLTSVQRSVVENDIRTRSNTQARLALETLDHEVRSGNVLYDPATSSDPYFRFKIYTQANATTRQPSPGYTCRLWRITSTGQLQTRWWPPLRPDLASEWRTAATGVVNKLVTTPLNAFTLDPDPNKGGRTVNVVLLVNEDPQVDLTRGTVRIQSALTGRNTSYGFPTGVCATEPID